MAAALLFPSFASAADPVIATAGDIACSSTTREADRCHHMATSDLLVNAGLSAVLTLGDAQYQNGELSRFMSSYNPTWGRVKSITYPSAGNHEYQTSGAAGYFDYFNGAGQQTGRAGDRSKGYYSFNIGTWHLISLNSSDKCTIVSCAAGSAQEQWLRADLAANTNYCTLAYWHHPSFNSGNGGNLSAIRPLLDALYQYNADVILGGHAHHYERFAPQNPSSQADNARGIRQFVVGTGGAFWTSISSPKPNSQVRQNTTYGVLKMTLHPTSYDWVFVPEAGGTFTDAGTGQCHGSSGTPPDTTVPTPPTNLQATAGTGQVSLTWGAATDNVGVTGYQVFRGSTQVATVTSTSWTDTGLAAGNYSYTVRAVDAAGNQSNSSNTASATVPDTTKPGIPPNLSATPGTGQVSLTWGAATDNVGVTGYRVFRGLTQVGAPTGTSFTDTGLGAGTYSYTVRAVDAAGNISDPSTAVDATVPDTTKPGIPPNLQATPSAGQVSLTWGTASDNVGVTGYRVFRGATQVGAPTGTSYTDTGLAAGTYSYTVRAVDAAGNVSDPSTAVNATVPDTTKPTAPASLGGTVSAGQVALTWQASTDNVGVTGYRVFRGTTQVGTVNGTTTSYTDTGVPAGTHSYTVRAVDAAGNLSDPSNTHTATVPDTTKPTAPANLTGTASAGQVALSWQASTDDVGVTGYRVFRGTTQIATLGGTVTSHTDTGLAPGNYSYTVRAIDAAGNLSDPSNTHSATVPDTTKPSAPGSLTGTPGAGQVALSWQASTDNVAVTGYRVFRGATQVGSVNGSTTTYTDTGLAAGTYSYTVRAIDAAGNLSDPSNAFSTTVPDTTKPAAPQNLTAGNDGFAQVQLVWDAATDDVEVTGYNVYRNGSLIGSSSSPAYDDQVLLPGTYRYVVRAFDAAGNLSDPSNEASATMLGPDVVAPTTPGNLTATLTGYRVDLAWEASSDNTGVTSYKIYRDGTLIKSISPATSYSDTSVLPGEHTYEVRAADGAGNLSDPSNPASATVPDHEPPTAPGNLQARAVTSAEVDLTWEEATDNVAVAGYDIYREGLLIDTIGPTGSYADTSVSPGTYSYQVAAFDAAGNVSDVSNGAAVTVLPPDVERPTAPGNLTGTTGGPAEVDLTWEASTDDRGVTAYDIYRNGTLLASVGATTAYADGSVVPGNTYSYEARARDAAGNVSDPSNTATVTVDPLDTQKPTAPGNLLATRNGADHVDLTWNASSDNRGVIGYRVYRGGELIATLGTTTTYDDGPLGAGTYQYEVRALDAAGNVSDPSNTATVSIPDVEKPTAPANLVATIASPTQVDLTWQASTDNVGVTAYRVFRGATQIASVGGTATSYSDTSPAAGNQSYTVRAADAAGNVSDPSNSASATVPDTTKPTAPANLVATRNGASQVDLTWQSASDNIGVTGYRIFRGSTQVGTVGGTTLAYSDSPVGAGTHQYTVRAVDAAGNVSDPSNASSVTVPDSQKPTPPVNLVATTVSASRVDLTWQAASDNVGVTGYQVFRGTSQIGSVSGTTFAYTDNSPGAGSQSYTVRAVDAAGNVSDPSNTATATVPDAQKPTAPSNLVATRNGASQVDLTWQASSDNVGVTGYQIFRGATQIGMVGGTTLSYSDTGLATGTYSYTVRAVDAAGNLSDPSNSSSVTVPDSQKPTPPGNLSATAVSPSQIDLSWQSSNDNVGVTGYRVFRGATQIASLGASATSHSDTGLAAGTYSYTVTAVDAADNVSDPSNAATATTQAPPQTLTLSPEADARVQASAATTNYGTSYLRVDGATNPAVESLLRFTVNGVTAGTVRSATLRLHMYSGTVDGPAVFTTNPSWSESAVNWNTRPARTSTPTDDKGAIANNSWVEYDVTQFVTGNGTYSFGLATTSSDGANMYSRENATLRPELVVSTGAPDTTKPTTPGNLSATAAGPNRIDLSWMASTDNVGVTGYNVYRGGTLLAGIAPATAYADTTVAANTTYGYQVRAFDAAANISDPSNTATATTPAAPTTLTIQPDADTRAQESQPTTNYGTSFLRTDGGTDLDVESYLRFTVNNVAAGSVLSAKLRVHAYSGSADGPALFTTGSSWSESTLNWNTRPAPTSAAMQDKTTIAANSWVEYDVTSIITGNGTYSFRLATTSTDGVDIYSRENATLRPELVVTLR